MSKHTHKKPQVDLLSEIDWLLTADVKAKKPKVKKPAPPPPPAPIPLRDRPKILKHGTLYVQTTICHRCGSSDTSTISEPMISYSIPSRNLIRTMLQERVVPHHLSWRTVHTSKFVPVCHHCVSEVSIENSEINIFERQLDLFLNETLPIQFNN